MYSTYSPAKLQFCTLDIQYIRTLQYNTNTNHYRYIYI